MNKDFFKYIPLTTNKSFEIQLSKFDFDNWFSVTFEWSRKRDHAGLDFNFQIGPYFFGVLFYDNRHWNEEKDCWEVYGHNIPF